MRLYGDVEHTGFYEKMNNRFKIALVLKHLWHLESHRPAFLKLAKDEKSFEIFANGVVNHTSDLVTTALSKLPEIRTWCSSARVGLWRWCSSARVGLWRSLEKAKSFD